MEIGLCGSVIIVVLPCLFREFCLCVAWSCNGHVNMCLCDDGFHFVKEVIYLEI